VELTILGTSAAYAGANQNCPAYLITSGEQHYLVDAGPGSVSFLQNFITIQDLTGVFLSHLHPDHFTDIYTLRYAVFITQDRDIMKKNLPLYLPKKPFKSYNTIRKAVREEFSVTPLDRENEIRLDGLKVRLKKTSHAITAFAMRFEDQHSHSSLVYTADTAYFDGLVLLCKGANILLSEATFQNSEKELGVLGHMTAEQAGTLAQDAGVHTLVLTHIMPYYDRRISLEEAKKSFDGHVVVAEKGQKFTF
jgi:ribonuclease BN (tRNA processing enzyme)